VQNKICMHYLISGHVQGVFFRASTQEQANTLGLTGWTRNLDNGQVEVVACGETEKLMQFYAWLLHGPERAKVEKVISEEIPWQQHARFAVK